STHDIIVDAEGLKPPRAIGACASQGASKSREPCGRRFEEEEEDEQEEEEEKLAARDPGTYAVCGACAVARTRRACGLCARWRARGSRRRHLAPPNRSSSLPGHEAGARKRRLKTAPPMGRRVKETSPTNLQDPWARRSAQAPAITSRASPAEPSGA
ncbi:unnamed protein product, partial [Prorocentrum cordatum]